MSLKILTMMATHTDFTDTNVVFVASIYRVGRCIMENNIKKFLVPCWFAIEDDKVFQGFYDKSDKYWNGWLNPYVTEEVRKQILEYYIPPELRDELQMKRQEAFDLEDFDEENPWLDYWDQEPDSKTNLYYFGSRFIWSEVTEEELARRVVEDIQADINPT